MSEQISEAMARKIYNNGCTTEKYLEDEDAFVYNLRSAGLIKKISTRRGAGVVPPGTGK